MKKLPKEIVLALSKPLDHSAISQHPTKKMLSVIKPIFITERLNDVFGHGSWSVESEIKDTTSHKKTSSKGREYLEYEVLSRTTLTILHGDDVYCYHSWGGSTNEDLGDAAKGAESDGIGKICAVYLGIGTSVYKGQGNGYGSPRLAVEEWADEIEQINTVEELKAYYEKNKGKGSEFDRLVVERKKQLLTPAKNEDQ